MSTYTYTALSGTAPPLPYATKASSRPAPTTFPQSKAGTSKAKDKQYNHACPHCDRFFSCPHNVKQHIREKHTGEKPFACDHCIKKFTRPWTLYRHLSMIHNIEAGPGRGKGGGMARVGGMRHEPEVQENTVSFEGFSQLPAVEQSYTVAKPKTFEVNNFTPARTMCQCGREFGNMESFISHLHREHDQPESAYCNCMICTAKFGSSKHGVAVEAKGVSVFQGLMAADLFRAGDERGVEGGVPGATFGHTALENAFATNINMDGYGGFEESVVDDDGLRDAAMEEAFAAHINDESSSGDAVDGTPADMSAFGIAAMEKAFAANIDADLPSSTVPASASAGSNNLTAAAEEAFTRNI